MEVFYSKIYITKAKLSKRCIYKVIHIFCCFCIFNETFCLYTMILKYFFITKLFENLQQIIAIKFHHLDILLNVRNL